MDAYDDDTAISVQFIDGPSAPGDPATAAAEFASRFEGSGTVVSSIATTQSGLPAHDSEILLSTGDTQMVRVFFVGNRLYVIHAFGVKPPTDAFNHAGETFTLLG